MRYRGPPAGALVLVPLAPLVAVFHRPSGTTHLLADPAPQILQALTGEPLDPAAVLARLAIEYDLVDADRAALAERLAEMAEIGLVEAV